MKTNIVIVFSLVIFLFGGWAATASSTEVIILPSDASSPSEVKENNPNVVEVHDRIPSQGWVVEIESRGIGVMSSAETEESGELSEINNVNRLLKQADELEYSDQYRLYISFFDEEIDTRIFNPSNPDELETVIRNQDKAISWVRYNKKEGAVPNHQTSFNISEYTTWEKNVKDEVGFEFDPLGVGKVAHILEPGLGAGLMYPINKSQELDWWPNMYDSEYHDEYRSPSFRSRSSQMTRLGKYYPTDYESAAHHATQTAHIVGGDNLHHPDIQGYYPNITIFSQDTDEMNGYGSGEHEFFIESAKQATDKGILISSNSWSSLRSEFGVYDDLTAGVDTASSIYGETDEEMLWVWSAGNSGLSDDENGTMYHTNIGKNVVTVGAIIGPNRSVDDWSDRADFASTGPTRDGRIKPDITAQGTNFPGMDGTTEGDTMELSGTSFSAPSVAGGLFVLNEQHNVLFGDEVRGSFLKGLMLHKAENITDNPGPSYRHGWGNFNLYKKGLYMNRLAFENLHHSAYLEPGEQHDYEFYIEERDNFRVTLYWDDPVPETNFDEPLRNNKHLELESPSGDIYYPWSLPHEAPPVDAERDSPNNVDNVNVVDVDNPESGNWTARVYEDFMSVDEARYELFFDEFGSNQSLDVEVNENNPIEKLENREVIIEDNGFEEVFLVTPGNSYYEFKYNGSEYVFELSDINTKHLNLDPDYEIVATNNNNNNNRNSKSDLDIEFEIEPLIEADDEKHGSLTYNPEFDAGFVDKDNITIIHDGDTYDYDDAIEFDDEGTHTLEVESENSFGSSSDTYQVSVQTHSPEFEYVEINELSIEQDLNKYGPIPEVVNPEIEFKVEDEADDDVECYYDDRVMHELGEKETGEKHSFRAWNLHPSFYYEGFSRSHLFSIICKNSFGNIGQTDFNEFHFSKDKVGTRILLPEGPVKKGTYNETNQTFEYAINTRTDVNEIIYGYKGEIEELESSIGEVEVELEEGNSNITFEISYTDDGEEKTLVEDEEVTLYTSPPSIGVDANVINYGDEDRWARVNMTLESDRVIHDEFIEIGGESLNFINGTGVDDYSISTELLVPRNQFEIQAEVQDLGLNTGTASTEIDAGKDIEIFEHASPTESAIEDTTVEINVSKNVNQAVLRLKGDDYIMLVNEKYENSTVWSKDLKETGIIDPGIYNYQINLIGDSGVEETIVDVLEVYDEVRHVQSFVDDDRLDKAVLYTLENQNLGEEVNGFNYVIVEDLENVRWNQTIELNETDVSLQNVQIDDQSYENRIFEVFDDQNNEWQFGLRTRLLFDQAEIKVDINQEDNKTVFKCDNIKFKSKTCNQDWVQYEDYHFDDGDLVVKSDSFSAFAYSDGTDFDVEEQPSESVAGGSGTDDDDDEEEDEGDTTLLELIIRFLSNLIQRIF